MTATAKPGRSASAASPRRRARTVREVKPGLPMHAAFIGEDGALALDLVADSFGMSKTQLAAAAGIGRDSLYKAARKTAPKTRARVSEMLEIISRVQAWAGGQAQAMAWYRAQPIPALGGRTAEALVKSGEATAVRDYLDHIALGGFA